MKKKLLLLGVLVLIVVAAWHLFDLGDYLNLYYIQSRQPIWQRMLDDHPVQVGAIFFLVYVLLTGLSIPGTLLLTLLAGSLFGVVTGTLIVSVACTLGATVAFLIARYLARDAVQKRFSGPLATINDGIKKEGGFYLCTIRLIPVSPFVLVNLLMGLTPIPLWSYIWITYVSMLPGIAIYVNAGTQLSRLDSAQGILSPALIVSLVLLGLLPLMGKKTVAYVRAKRASG